MIFLIIFIVVPLVELYFMLQVGEVVGAFSTVLLVVFTAIAGGLLVRQQGFSTMLRMRETAARGETPALEMIEGSILLLSGIMLLLPGFITDALGFLLLVPPLRKAFILWLLRRTNVLYSAQGFSHSAEARHSVDHSLHGDKAGRRRIIEIDSWTKED
jgi:UPF0716 protein FxsA